MQKLTMFYLETCPYCLKAMDALKALREINPAYGEVEIEMIEESRQPELADQYDYYATPTIYAGDRKLYEAKLFDSYEVIKDNLQAALDLALKG